ncbi:hypothetical protein X732_30595 [Mesorhizobium sp. L2C066B000]|nr:hypothetical protein X732_30595 [Mesorhizobium sp. L2C066B000]
MIFEAIRKRWPWIKYLFADGGYDRMQLLEQAALSTDQHMPLDCWYRWRLLHVKKLPSSLPTLRSC